MEGSVHTDDPHKEVRLVTEENYKILAFNFDLDEQIDIFESPTEEDDEDDVDTDDGADTETTQTTAVPPTGVPQPDSGDTDFVTIEDPNVPDSTPDRIY